MHYGNLEVEMFYRSISNKQLAFIIGCNVKTIYEKLDGRSGWTLKEVLKILDAFKMTTASISHLFKIFEEVEAKTISEEVKRDDNI